MMRGWMGLTGLLLLAGCGGGGEAPDNGAAPVNQAAIRAAEDAPRPPLGLVAGYYIADSEFCSEAPGGAYYYDGQRAGMMVPGQSGPDTLQPVGQPERRGEAWVMADGSEITLVAPDRIRIGDGPERRRCTSIQVPANIRVPA